MASAKLEGPKTTRPSGPIKRQKALSRLSLIMSKLSWSRAVALKLNSWVSLPGLSVPLTGVAKEMAVTSLAEARSTSLKP